MDTAGRVTGAPAWDGDLATVSPHGLEEHERGLCGHIANLTVRRREVPAGDPVPWEVSTVEHRRTHGFEQWIERLVTIRTEQARRHEQVGDFNVYLSLMATPRWFEPWSPVVRREDTVPNWRSEAAVGKTDDELPPWT